MSKEIEVKVVGIEFEILEKKLKELGAGLLSFEEQTNYIIDSKGRLDKDGTKGYLRLREIDNKLLNKIEREITLKKNMKNIDARENIEITSEISDIDAMLEILKNLGYDLASVGHKLRKSYLFEDIRFDFDTWDKEVYPYPYMEIEVKSKDDLSRALDLLEIDEKHVTTKSIVELQEDLKNQTY